MSENGIILSLGLLDYRKAWRLQHGLWSRRVKGSLPDTVLFLEHPHTITLGKRSDRSNLISPDMLERLEVPVINVERGGDVTYHGPGQAVVYPIINLQANRLDVGRYVDLLEELIILVLRDFGIEGETNPVNRGVWVGGDKIASIGVAISKRVSFHGLALNINTDLIYFDLIRPCGMVDTKMTSMAKVSGGEVSTPAVFRSLKSHFKEIFGKVWVERPLGEFQSILDDDEVLECTVYKSLHG